MSRRWNVSRIREKLRNRKHAETDRLRSSPYKVEEGAELSGVIELECGVYPAPLRIAPGSVLRILTKEVVLWPHARGRVFGLYDEGHHHGSLLRVQKRRKGHRDYQTIHRER